MGTQKESEPKGKTGANTGGEIQANPYFNPMVLRGANKSSEGTQTICRKAAIVCIPYPYRKPTQVDEERILRPAGEALLRNSAK